LSIGSSNMWTKRRWRLRWAHTRCG